MGPFVFKSVSIVVSRLPAITATLSMVAGGGGLILCLMMSITRCLND